MPRTHAGVILISALVAVGAASPTQIRPLPPHPDLSGTWSVTSTESLAHSPFGARFTVKQDQSSITITGDREAVTYQLDDSRNVRTTQSAAGTAWTRRSRARFVTAALLVTTEIDAGQTGHWEDMFIVSLDRPGLITVVACNAVMAGGMGTYVFKYSKAQ